MAKATQDGVYVLNGHRYVAHAGDVLPEGAEMEGSEPATEARADGPAPETKAKGAAPENRAKK